MRWLKARKDLLSCLGLVLFVLFLFPDIVFHNLDQSITPLATDVPNRDSLTILFPFFFHFIDSLREFGHVDPWNPYLWGGTPAIGNPNVPFNLLVYALVHLSREGFIVAMNWHLVTQFFAAATGLYLVSRQLGLHWYQCVLIPVLALCSSSAAWMTSVQCIFFHWAILPWALLLLLTQHQRRPLVTVALLATLFYFQMTYGQSQMTLYSAGFLLLCVTWIFRERFHRRTTLRRLASAFAMGAALAAHSILPQIEYLLLANDRVSTSWLKTSARFQVSPRYLLNLFVPRLFWSPLSWWPRWNDGWSPWESFNVSIGLLLTLIATYSLRELWFTSSQTTSFPFVRRMKILIPVLVVLNCTQLGGALLVAANLGKAVPYSRLTQFLLYPLVFGAVAELPLLLTRKKALGGFVIFLSTTLIALGFFSRHFDSFVMAFYAEAARSAGIAQDYADTAHRFLALNRQNISNVFFSTATSLVAALSLLTLSFILFRFPKLRVSFFALAILVGLVDEIGFFDAHRRRGIDPYPFNATLGRNNPLLEALRARKKELEDFNFSTYTGRMEPDTGLAPDENAIFRIPSLNGYTSFVPPRTEFEPTYYRGNWGYAFPETAAKLLSIRYVLLGPETPDFSYRPRLRPVAHYREYLLTEYVDAVPKFFFPDEVQAGLSPVEQRRRMRESTFDPQRRSYIDATSLPADLYSKPKKCAASFRHASRHSSEMDLILENTCASEIYFAFPRLDYPWWHYKLDGGTTSPVRINLVQQAVKISSGTHHLEMLCTPWSWYVGLVVSLLGAVGLAACLVKSHFRPRTLI